MAELSRRSGTAVPTIKYYLREGLLPPGQSVGATRARYDEAHVARLRLIRALVEVAALSLEQVRAVLESFDEAPDPGAAIGAAHLRLSPPPPAPPSEKSRGRVAGLLADRGWLGEPDGPHATALATALDRMESVEQPLADASLGAYAEAAAAIARTDLAALGDRRGAEAATYAVLGTLLVEPVLVALRRMAQEDLARRGLSGER